MCNQTGRALEELPVLIAKGVYLFALGVEHPDNVTVTIGHRNDNF
jgi:hypothetical protein